jgi:hypothetical protein
MLRCTWMRCEWNIGDVLSEFTVGTFEAEAIQVAFAGGLAHVAIATLGTCE